MNERPPPSIGQFTVRDILPSATAANRRPVNRICIPSHFGYGTVVGVHCAIYVDVVVGLDCRIGDHAVIREGTIIGDRCVIGTNADIQYGCTIGNDVRIMNGAHITGGTVIGDGSFIGPGVMTANDKHVDLDDYQDRGQTAPVIGRKVMIGVGAKLLPGVKIGDRAQIAAGAVVTKDVPARELWAGVPARVVRAA